MRALLLAAAALLLAGCSGGSSPTDNPEGDQNAKVEVRDFNFNPSTVNIGKGSTVEWTNTGQQKHTVTFRNNGPDSGELGNGEKWPHTFQDAGTFEYFCELHPSMTGTIRVT